MATTTLESISTALEQVDGKKANLEKVFEDLQAAAAAQNSSSSAAFANLKWEDLDSHFTSLHSNLLQKFSLLQSLEPRCQPKPSSVENHRKLDLLAGADPVPARPELRYLCEKMDGLGLRGYILDRPKERGAIRVELADAWKHAPDPAKMVLDAMQGLFVGSGRAGDLGGVRRVCVILLEEFVKAGLEIGVEAKKGAKVLAVEWKGKIAEAAAAGDQEEEGLAKLTLLHLLAAFWLGENDGFDMNELTEYAVDVARYRQAVELCRNLGFGDRICDVVQKLIGKGKQLLALKFIFQFELTDKYPPVPLLKAYVSDSQKLAQRVRKNGKSSRQALNEAAAKEISALKSVIKIIEDHNLDSEYPKDILLKSVDKLEKEKTSRKRAAVVPALKGQHPSKQQKQSGSKNARKNGATGPLAVHKNATAISNIPPIQQSHAQTAGLLADPYLNSPATAYGLAGSAPAAAPYAGASAGVYGLSVPTGFSGNPDPSVSNLYSSELQMQPTYYDRQLVYGGYALPPQYHQVYYPQ